MLDLMVELDKSGKRIRDIGSRRNLNQPFAAESPLLGGGAAHGGSDPWSGKHAEEPDHLCLGISHLPHSQLAKGSNQTSVVMYSFSLLVKASGELLFQPPYYCRAIQGTHRRQTSRRILQALRGIGVSKDVIVATEKDVAEHGNNPSLVLKPAIEEGRELYATG
jgi:hypothetical protein